MEFLGGIFGEFLGIFLGGFFGRNFFGGIFLGGFFWEEFFVYIVKVICYLNMKGINLFVSILVFVKILSQGRRKGGRN